MRPILSFDIGSTYTKAALFDLEAGRWRLVRRDSLPTTIHDLAVGFSLLKQRLLERDGNFREGEGSNNEYSQENQNIPIYACSSAKGGLAIAAIGIVPDLTLSVAKLAAASAGGKIVASYSYKLAADQVSELKNHPPDVILFSGGTDGGNEDYNLHNARILARANLDSAVLYAGNASLRGEIRNILGQTELFITENLMPEIGKLQIEPTRAKIQEIFLKKIIEGKGLETVAAGSCGELKPTPRSVFDLLEKMAERLPHWNDSMILDLGGATTDLYSSTESFRGETGYVLKGIREPKLKRTVEGDLGMRISARSTWETSREHIERQLEKSQFSRETFLGFISKVSSQSEYIPQSTEELFFDDLLAGACVYHSLRRHAGSIEECYTPNGKVFVQQGKDLRGVKKMILSGGFLSRQKTAIVCQTAIAAACEDAGGLQLLPEQVEFYADAHYLLPLLGNLAKDHPAEAIQLAEQNLIQIPK